MAELDYTDIVGAISSGLHDFPDAIQGKLNGVGDRITHTFFAQRRQGRIVSMTYCVAMNVEDGIVGLSDTLITSGREVTTLGKVNVYSPPRGTFFVMTSGLRSLRDKTLTYFENRLAERASRDEPFERLYQAVNLLAEQVRTVAHEDKAALRESGMGFNIHALIGGQMERDARQKLYLLYPEGNWVDTGRLTPYHVIGSVGYGKPLIDRTLRVEDSMRHAFKVACLSFDSTRISAADVGFPIDIVLYRKNSFRIIERRFRKQDLEQLSRWWEERIRHAIDELPGEMLDRAYDEIETPPPAPVSNAS